MRPERDIERVLIAMRQVIQTQAIPFIGCGINVIDDSTSPPSVRHHNMTPDGQWQQTSGSRGSALVYRFWREGHTIYRPDIVGDDHFDEAAHIEQIIEHPVRSSSISPSPSARWPSIAISAMPSAPHTSSLWK